MRTQLFAATWLAVLSAAGAELLGQQASAHLMIQLVDSLASACDLYLNDQAALGSQVEALGPQQVRWDEPDEDDEFPSTKPMNWSPSGQEAEEEEEVEGELSLSTSGCWLNAIQWLKAQLLAVRMQLLLAAEPNPVYRTLERFAHLNQSLVGFCPASEPEAQLPSREPMSVSYVRQSIEAVAEIAAQVKASPPAPFWSWSGHQANSASSLELAAIEAVELNFGHLSEIIGAYANVAAASQQPAELSTGTTQ